jgi:methylenetetrahydrofolate reductase (NADPH)
LIAITENLMRAATFDVDACKTDEEVRNVGVDVCTDICSKLIKHGTNAIHIYSLNRVPSSEELVKNLGLI